MEVKTEIVESKFGTYKVFSNDKHITKCIKNDRMLHPTVFNWICSNINDGSFLDIGANIGLYSVGVNKQVGCDVFSIEAHPQTYQLLEYNSETNSNNIHTFNVGASDVSGSMTMNKIESTPKFNTGDMRLINNGEFVVDIQRVDHLIDSSCKIDVIKIDVQGHDYKALLGCDSIIKAYTPTVIIEWESHMVKDGSKLKDVSTYLSKYGYTRVKTYQRDHMYKVK